MYTADEFVVLGNVGTAMELELVVISGLARELFVVEVPTGIAMLLLGLGIKTVAVD